MKRDDFGAVDLWRRWQQRAPVGRTASFGLMYDQGRTTEGIVLCWGRDWVDIAVPRGKTDHLHEIATLRLDQVVDVELVYSYEEEAGLFTVEQTDWWQFNPASYYLDPDHRGKSPEVLALSGYTIQVPQEGGVGQSTEFLPLEGRWDGLHCQVIHGRRGGEVEWTLDVHEQFKAFRDGTTGWEL